MEKFMWKITQAIWYEVIIPILRIRKDIFLQSYSLYMIGTGTVHYIGGQLSKITINTVIR